MMIFDWTFPTFIIEGSSKQSLSPVNFALDCNEMKGKKAK